MPNEKGRNVGTSQGTFFGLPLSPGARLFPDVLQEPDPFAEVARRVTAMGQDLVRGNLAGPRQFAVARRQATERHAPLELEHEPLATSSHRERTRDRLRPTVIDERLVVDGVRVGRTIDVLGQRQGYLANLGLQTDRQDLDGLLLVGPIRPASTPDHLNGSAARPREQMAVGEFRNHISERMIRLCRGRPFLNGSTFDDARRDTARGRTTGERTEREEKQGKTQCRSWTQSSLTHGGCGSP